MNGPDITIGLKTVGDTTGAKAVEKSLSEVKDEAKETASSLSDLEAFGWGNQYMGAWRAMDTACCSIRAEGFAMIRTTV